uniref:Uncharacterized protein n=1 Tax=Arundo donax TaxID=35708 RepID=A0A0A8ZKF6_ARUDO
MCMHAFVHTLRLHI